jgi:hypothetical protein
MLFGFCSNQELQPSEWSRKNHSLFPAEFRAVVRQLVRGHYSAASVLRTLPMEVLELVIGRLARDAFSFETAGCTASVSCGEHEMGDDADPTAL